MSGGTFDDVVNESPRSLVVYCSDEEIESHRWDSHCSDCSHYLREVDTSDVADSQPYLILSIMIARR